MNKLELTLNEVFGVNINTSEIISLKEIDQWDSVTRVRLIVALEDVINRELSDEEVERLDEIQLLKNIVDE